MTFGSGQHGQLGHGNGFDYLKPKIVETLEDSTLFIRDVSCGSTVTSAITGIYKLIPIKVTSLISNGCCGWVC